MGIFNKSSLKMRSESSQNNTRYYIDYHKQKDMDLFVSGLLGKISSGENYFAVIDTKMMYRTNGSTDEKLARLMYSLNNLGMKYKELSLESDGKISLFGASINLSDKRKTRDTLLGIIIDAENIHPIKQLLNNYCIYYYTGRNKEISNDELLIKFEETSNVDKLKAYFDYEIFDSFFIKQITINTKNQNSQFVKQIIESFDK